MSQQRRRRFCHDIFRASTGGRPNRKTCRRSCSSTDDSSSSACRKKIREIQNLSLEEQEMILMAILQGNAGQRLFKAADRNHDGVLSRHEFQSMTGKTKWMMHQKMSHSHSTSNGAIDDELVSSSSSSSSSSSPSWLELRRLMLCTALPFVGFGFLDNFIMLTAGEWIDSSIGSTLHLSTLTAAALGNTVSDVAGLGMGGLIERLSHKVGVKAPALSPQQRKMTQTRVCVLTGSTFGLTLGCVMGMIPLVFI